jgi:hypothetical protein
MPRIDFLGYSSEDSLEPISWEEFFEKFEQNRLAFFYEDTADEDKKSRFNEPVSRETVEQRSEAREQDYESACRSRSHASPWRFRFKKRSISPQPVLGRSTGAA